MDHMPAWRRELEVFPVLPLEDLVARIHRYVNPLPGHDHIQQLLAQLAIMGEVSLAIFHEHGWINYACIMCRTVGTRPIKKRKYLRFT